MRNFKTDKGYKVVVDYIDWYYSRRDIRDYYALDDEWVFICYPWDRELREIMDLDIPKEWINRLLWRQSWVEDTKENLPWRDWSLDEDELNEQEEYYLQRYGEYEKEYEIRPFYISYYGSGNYRVQFCTADEAQWMMLIKRRKIGTKAAEEIWKKLFETYIEWCFMYTQVYSPHQAEFVEWNYSKDHSITYYDYEDWEIFCLTEEDAINWIPEYAGKILPKTESQNFESFELSPKEKPEEKTDN